MVMHGDYQCSFSAEAQGTVRDLLAAYPGDLRVVWKNLPLAFHKDAALAAEAAMAAHEQGKFWEFHDRLLANQDNLGREGLETLAGASGLDLARLRAALDQRTYRKVVQAEAERAAAAGLNGTPSFVILGQVTGDQAGYLHIIPGNYPLAMFKHVVDTAVAKVKGLPPPPAPPPVPMPAPGIARRPETSWPPHVSRCRSSWRAGRSPHPS